MALGASETPKPSSESRDAAGSLLGLRHGRCWWWCTFVDCDVDGLVEKTYCCAETADAASYYGD